MSGVIRGTFSAPMVVCNADSVPVFVSIRFCRLLSALSYAATISCSVSKVSGDVPMIASSCACNAALPVTIDVALALVVSAVVGT